MIDADDGEYDEVLEVLIIKSYDMILRLPDDVCAAESGENVWCCSAGGAIGAPAPRHQKTRQKTLSQVLKAGALALILVENDDR